MGEEEFNELKMQFFCGLNFCIEAAITFDMFSFNLWREWGDYLLPLYHDIVRIKCWRRDALAEGRVIRKGRFTSALVANGSSVVVVGRTRRPDT